MEEENTQDMRYEMRIDDLPGIKRRLLEGQLLWQISKEMRIDASAIRNDFSRMAGVGTSCYKSLMRGDEDEEILVAITEGKPLEEIAIQYKKWDARILRIYLEERTGRNLEELLKTPSFFIEEIRKRKKYLEKQREEDRLAKELAEPKVKKEKIKYAKPLPKPKLKKIIEIEKVKKEVKQEYIPRFSDSEWDVMRIQLLKSNDITSVLEKNHLDVHPKIFAKSFIENYGVAIAVYKLAVKNYLSGIEVPLPTQKISDALKSDVNNPEIESLFPEAREIKKTLEERKRNEANNLTALEHKAILESQKLKKQVVIGNGQIDMRRVKAKAGFVHNDLSSLYYQPAIDGARYVLSRLPVVGTPEQIKEKYKEAMANISKSDEESSMFTPHLGNMQYRVLAEYMRKIFIDKLGSEDYLRIFFENPTKTLNS